MPLFAARIKSTPDDFQVTEVIGFEFSGDGEHDFLFIEKTGNNTEWVARQLARFADVPARDIGYAGLKDRNAITRQWFSVPRWYSPDWTQLQIDGVALLRVERHLKKLRRGSHRQNRFRLVLRGDCSDSAAVEERLRLIASRGVPNYFGDQRFGRDAGNIRLADGWASGKRLPRHQRSLAISTARSFMFNEELAGRIEARNWDSLTEGDVANLDGSGSVFTVEAVDETILARCRELDIHPAGLMPGDGDDVAGRELWMKALAKGRVDSARRSLRLRVADLQWSIEPEAVTLEFALVRGSFATSVLRELASIS
ncbi:MAG: tRNA pseudouridine(13) synthase TruD [Gammaproteobacteria bacterium]|nr:tRNA pseudouridine(13) synthase TruD [Gammaproteobacteria bacterium]